MAQRSFGQLDLTLFDRRRRDRAILLLGVSLAAIALVMPARGASITYSDGQDRSAPIAMTEDTVATVNEDETATQSGVISGAYSFGKTGLGALTLSGNNTFSGGTNLDMGALVLRHSGALGTGLLTMADGTRLIVPGSSTFTLANNIQLDGVGEFSGNAFTHVGVISGAGRLLVNGNVTLGGNNTHGGGTDLATGQLRLMHNGALGSGTLTMGADTYLAFDPAAAMVFDNEIVLARNYANLLTASAVTLNGTISGAGGLIKYGPSTLILTGENTYGGGTALNSGTLRVENDKALGSDAVQIQQDARLDYADGVTIDNDLSPSTGAVLNVGNGTATQTGNITGPSLAGGFYKTGTGELVLLGNAYYGGNTHIVGGTLTAGADGVLSATSLHVLDQAARLNLRGDQTIGGLSGSGTVDLEVHVLTLNPEKTTSTFDGTLIGTADSGLVMTGSQTLTLDGDNESYGGTLRVESGPVYIQGDYSGMATTINGGILGGYGRLDAVVVNGGTLAGYDGYRLTMDSLTLGENARILAQLGATSSDSLFNVNGDLVLDGTLDVEDIGGFDPGIYRLFDYGGALTDNGLEIGNVPSDYTAGDLEVQTSVAGQINLLRYTAAAGDTLFWDGGDQSLWENGLIDGGDGVWGAASSFTTADGLTNSSQNPSPGFVVFAGKAGNVQVGSPLMAPGDGVAVTGMQFATSGYTIDGDPIEITAGDRIVRVGDGTADGADYVATIDSELTGEGTLIKSDLGTLVLNNNQNTYTGGTEVRAGTLEVNGTIGNVLVGQNGRLTGSGVVDHAEILGTISAGSVYPRDPSVAPTPDFGTLRIMGDLVLSDTSLFELNVDADGNFDLVEVNGTAYLDGDVLALASGGDYAAAVEYTFLTAGGGIEGEFDGVSANLAFLEASLAYSENDVRLTLIRNATTFGDIGNTANQKATGVAVETLGVGNAVYDRVLTLDADDARAGFDQLSGEVHASTKAALLTSGQAVAGTMQDRVAAAFAQLEQQQEPASGLSFWSEAGGTLGVLEANGNAAATSFGAGNLFIGADAVFNQNLVFGAMIGYGATNTTVADRSSTATSDNFHVGVYGGGEVEDFTFKFGAGYTQHNIDTARSVTMPGFAERLTSTQSGGTGQVFGEIGHKFAFDSGLIIEPFANLAHASLFTGGFAENGGASALSGGASYASTTHLTLGVRGETDFAIGELAVTAKGMIGWRHAVGSVEPTSTQAFSNGTAFTVSGSPVARDTAIVEAGLDFNLSPNMDLSIGYDGQFGSGMQHGIKTNLSVKF